MSELISITLNDGKYTIRQTEPGKWEALRYGEEWPAFRDSGPDNLHVALAYEVDRLQKQLADTQPPPTAKWGLEELVAKALCHQYLGDVQAVDVKGRQRWTWYVEDARKFINSYGHSLQHYGTTWDGVKWSAPKASP
ncbi:MAG: hypothetical protein DI604_28100 [Delftia acidovorans]|nr:MAG: hypothetical protein DI604_28100 [Delftia acidovorans]